MRDDAQTGMEALAEASGSGWRATTAATVEHLGPLWGLCLLRLHAVLGELNNLLLPPLFVLILIELLSGGLPEVAAVELDGFSILFAVTFLSEWALGLWLASHRVAYLRNVWLGLDFLSALPLATAFQTLRLTRMARVLRLAKLMRLWRSRSRRLPLGPVIRAGAVCCSLAACGAVAMQAMEPQVVPSLSESMWWAATTITTVGYGDVVPETVGGRIVAVFLMVSGIGVFSYLAGVMATAVFDPEEDEILETVRRLEAQLVSLSRALEARGASDSQAGLAD